MPTYAHFSQSGQFSYTFEASSVPPIPLADDGKPRTVLLTEKPEKDGKKFTPTRDGAWAESDADPIPVPSPLPAWRIRTVLRRRGLLETVEAMIAQLSEPPRIVVEEQMKSSSFERNHPIIEQFGAALGLTSAQLDDIFREADALV